MIYATITAVIGMKFKNITDTRMLGAGRASEASEPATGSNLPTSTIYFM